MGRGYTRADLENLIARVRNRVPDAVLRSTVIVGFPGETEDEFSRLCDFLSVTRFDNLGAFMYSREEGTRAARLKGHPRKGIKNARFQRVMEIQKEISRNNMKGLEGRPTRVIVEAEEGGRKVGRMLSQAPDVDGVAFIQGDCTVGEIREGVVVGTLDYDVIVRVGGADGANT
jgi:ribosomal protein S12 methylthiotransferase